MKNIVRRISLVICLCIVFISCEEEKVDDIVTTNSGAVEDKPFDPNWEANLTADERILKEELDAMIDIDPRGSESDEMITENKAGGAVGSVSFFPNGGNHHTAVVLYQHPDFKGKVGHLYQYIPQSNNWWSHTLNRRIKSVAVRPNTHMQVRRGNRVIYEVKPQGQPHYRRDICDRFGVCQFEKGDVVRYRVVDRIKRLAGYAYSDPNFRGAKFPIWMGGNVFKGRTNNQLKYFNDRLSSFQSAKTTSVGSVVFSRNFGWRIHEDIAFPGVLSLQRMNGNDRASSYHVRWR